MSSTATGQVKPRRPVQPRVLIRPHGPVVNAMWRAYRAAGQEWSLDQVAGQDPIQIIDEAIYAVWKARQPSYPDLAMAIGRRAHSTSRQAVKRCEAAIAQNNLRVISQVQQLIEAAHGDQYREESA